MMYLIRNPATGGWLDTWRGAFETDSPFKAACKYGSEKAARKTARDLVKDHKMRNAKYASGEWQTYEDYKPEAERYEIVAFCLVEADVMSTVEA